MIINPKKISDVVLVYDQYYSKKPKAVPLALKRMALCCGLCLCSMMFVLAEYNLPVSPVVTALQSVLFSAGFSLLFLFFKKRFAVPSVLVLGTLIVLFVREEFMEKLSYFSDALWLVMDGRFVPGRILTDHDISTLTSDNLMYCEGVELGFGIIVFFFSMITAGCMFSKPHILPSLAVWIVLWIPPLMSEKFTFSFWIILALSLYMAAYAYATVYCDGTALCGGKYSSAIQNNERIFLKSLRKAPYLKRVGMRSVYYSKYFSVTMYTAAVFATIGLISANVFLNSDGIDYKELYDFIENIGNRSPFTNPFDNGEADDWFTDVQEHISSSSPTLSITSPGTGNQKILSVTNDSSAVVYLRGDIGIDFKGNSWTSPVNDEPKKWKDSGLSEFYRPVELSVLNTLQQMLYGESNSIVKSEVTVEYLCDSTITFLPAYSMDFGYFDSEMFSVYGDFVIRTSDSYDRIEKVDCTALVPVYTNMDDTGNSAIENLRSAAELATQHGGIADVINGGYFLGHYNVLDRYEEYVNDAYLSIGYDDLLMINDFLNESGLGSMLYGAAFDKDEIVSRYQKAALVAEYLRSNYTYSLNADNGRDDPLYSFLNDTKSGHCAMYASSMTLIMRSIGIPARYCTGFVVTPNGGTPTILRSKNLHAWCEVYLNELGWVTFDPTSSSQTGSTEGELNSSESVSSEISSDVSSDTSSEESSDISSVPSESESEEFSSFVPQTSSGVDNNSTDIKVNVVPYVLIIAALLAIAAVVVLIVRFYKNLGKRAVAAIKKIRASQNSEMLLEKILMVMSLCGVTPDNGEMPCKFYTRAEKYFGCSITDYKDILEAVAFSNTPIDKTDCARLAGLLERLYEAAEKRLNTMERIRLRLSVIRRK